MIFTKSDKKYERAASDKSERVRLLRKLRRRRAIGFWVGFLGIIGVVIALFALSGTAVTELKTLDMITSVAKFLAPLSIGLFCGSLLVDQDVKMLLLLGTTESDASALPAEQAGDGKPDPAAS